VKEKHAGYDGSLPVAKRGKRKNVMMTHSKQWEQRINHNRK